MSDKETNLPISIADSEKMGRIPVALQNLVNIGRHHLPYTSK